MAMNESDQLFQRPSLIERAFNRLFGAMVGVGLCLSHNYLLEVDGRKSGRLYSAPIDLLETDGRHFLVCPRGRSQWVRNAQASGWVVLRKGFSRRQFAIRALPDAEKPEILKAYLDRFKTTVQRYFPLPAGSAAEAFVRFAKRYPVFEIVAIDDAGKQ